MHGCSYKVKTTVKRNLGGVGTKTNLFCFGLFSVCLGWSLLFVLVGLLFVSVGLLFVLVGLLIVSVGLLFVLV